MSSAKSLGQLVESYHFWDIVHLWARESLEHGEIVARALARAVVFDGLKLQSVDARWVQGANQQVEFKGQPYVGFCANPQAAMCILRATALDHLLAIIHRAEIPSQQKLAEEFLVREDFRAWCVQVGRNISCGHLARWASSGDMTNSWCIFYSHVHALCPTGIICVISRGNHE